MPINPDLLIAAPMLQDSFVDKNGEAMAAGVITCFQDNSRTTLKNWYYQSGTPGNYTYIRLPNPLTLSAAGTICDINGVDTIPFFYPFSELDETVKQPYYITIVNHDQTNQITRANFPFIADETNESGQGSHENYIINNGFWRNIGTMNLTNVLDTVVAPSQHSGFSAPDIRFVKNITGGQDTVTFTKFPLTNTPILTDDITPEFYINHVCANTPTGETQKSYKFPISLHVNTLASVTYTATIQGQNMGGTSPGENVINLFILQDTGTGTSSPSPFLIGSISLNTTWTKYEFSTVFPPTAGLTLGAGGDDGLYLLVQMPLNINCDINFTRPSIYLSDDPPTNSFMTYDQVDSIANTPRTGDIRTSLNGFYPYGWIPMNNGTIGNVGSVASTRANQDAWQLYSLLWSLGKPYDTGGPGNAISQMYNPSLVAINYGSTAIADFTAGNILLLTQTLGRVMMGSVPTAALLQGGWKQTPVASNSAGSILFTVQDSSTMFAGQPVTFTTTGSLPGNIVANFVYYITNINIGGANTCQVSTSYAAAIAGTPVVAFTTAGASNSMYLNTSGALTGEYSHTQQAAELVNHTHALSGFTGLVVDAPGAAGITNVGTAAGTAVTLGVTGLSTQKPFNIVQPGFFYNIFIKL